MITKLTQAQIDKFPYYVKKWTDIGLCTEPANRLQAEKFINRSYQLSGLKPPEKIVWCGSPLSQALTKKILKVGASVLDIVVSSVLDAVWYGIQDSMQTIVWTSMRDMVWAKLGTIVWTSMGSVRTNVVDSISLMNKKLSSTPNPLPNFISRNENIFYSSHDAYWLAFYDYFRNELKLKHKTEPLTGLIELAKHCGWILPYENICLASERHCLLNIDEIGRLHSLSEPAVSYPDGWSIYAVHGVRVPEFIIKHPEEITIKNIEEEENAEVRRVMIDQYGKDRFIIDSGAISIHKDKFGELFRKEINDDEPLVMVKVKNSTPEPDGTFKDYFLRVPSDCQSAEQAVAWTFGFENDGKYNPNIET